MDSPNLNPSPSIKTNFKKKQPKERNSKKDKRLKIENEGIRKARKVEIRKKNKPKNALRGSLDFGNSGIKNKLNRSPKINKQKFSQSNKIIVTSRKEYSILEFQIQKIEI